MNFIRLFPALALLPLALPAAFPTLYMKPLVLQQLHSPTCITHAPDNSGRVFVCDQAGQIRIIKDGMLLPTPFMDISATAAVLADRKVFTVVPVTNYTERGLLSLAFHPGYADPGSPGFRKFYVNYIKAYQLGIDPPPVTDPPPNCTTVIAEFQASASNPDIALPATERKLLLYPQPQSNHNGGGMVFDSSGLLYIGSGDGGSSNDNNVGHTGGTAAQPTDGLGNGQDKTVYLGKILRIDPLGTNGPGGQYGIPPGNPFVGAGSGVKEEIYAYGIRNPWGLAFDDGPGGTGRLFCADVGQGRIEEVNIIVNGGNYGWRYMEGTERPTFSSAMTHPGGTLIPPIVEYAHPDITGTTLPKLGLSVTGGYVYRGSAIPALQGKYVFGDYGATSGAPSGILMGLEETAPNSGSFTLTQTIPLVGGNPFSMRVMCLGKDAAGEIYVGTKVSGGVMALENGLPNGGIYKLVAAPTNPAPITLTAVKDNSIFTETGVGGAELSNGTGDLFTGTAPPLVVGEPGEIRRALLAFDLSSVPTNTRVGSAILQLRLTSAETPVNNPQRNTFVNRVLQSWGEAGSFSAFGGAIALTGDATWVSRLYSPTSPQLWDNEGGDFSPDVSASFGIRSELGFYAFQGPQLAKDVQSWLATPATNHGWLLRSEEGTSSTTKRFSSHENADADSRPKLTLIHATPYQVWLATHYPTLLTGQFLDPKGDADGDGIINQIEYAYGFDPTSFNSADNFTTAQAPVSGNTELTLTFRRDTQATDLTYRLQISSDLTTWITIAESLTGAATTGMNGGSIQSDLTLTGSVNLVTVKRTLSGGDSSRQFVRLAVNRVP
jgi:glucose/arabinose dehydrogenase